MATASPPSASATPPPPPEDLEWEEWDSSTSPLSFGHHCLAGSFAGVAEHTLLYPLDTVKTCWQSQVLHGASVGGSLGCSGEPCGMAVGSSMSRGASSSMGGGGGGVLGNPLSQTVANEAKRVSSVASSSAPSNPNVNSNSVMHNQGIWSTMKHLMRQGNHGHSANQQFSHSHVYTLAGNPPNVVDMTTATAESVIGDTAITNKTKRPWSKQSRVLRNATMQDITAHGMIHSSGSGGGGSIAMNASDAALANSNNHAGFKRLWRGVQTMFVGCIPAHALYFSSYEMIKSMCTDQHHPHHHHQQSTDGEPGEHPQQHEGHVGHDTLSASQAMLAGGVATLLHDFVMTPMDTMKQRMQLGHYDNLRHAFASIVWGESAVATAPSTPNVNTGNNITGGSSEAMAKTAGEGWKGLYRSFPITVMTNVPYGMIMMTTNEWLRGVLEDGLYGLHQHEQHEENPFHFATILLSGMGAGTVASAVTAPLDRIKTRLQTQRMGMVLPGAANGGTSSTAAEVGNGTTLAIVEERALAAAQGQPKICPKMAVQDVKRTLFPSSAPTSASTGTISIPPSLQPSSQQQLPRTPFKTAVHYATPLEAFQSIVQEEGVRGLFRGTLPRVALHAPSVAISWTAYEMAKDWLIWYQQ